MIGIVSDDLPKTLAFTGSSASTFPPRLTANRTWKSSCPAACG
jgi:hypothetical protein